MRKSISAGSVSRQQLSKLASKSAMDLRTWLKGGLQKQAEEELPLYEGQPSGRSFVLSGSIKTLAIVLSWYASNIGVLLANKAILSNYKYKYPIFLTLLHMLACTFYSLLFIKLLKLVPYQPLSSRTQMLKISGLSLIFCLSVVAGNVSLRFLPVSFNQAIGATGPFFTALFAVLMTWKTEAMPVYATLIPIVLGIVIASGGEPLFNLFGFLMCLTSTSARACKSVLQGILLSSDSEKLNSMNLLMYMAPVASVALLPASLLMEGNVLAVTLQKGVESPRIFAYLAGNMTMAYLVNLMNFIVTKHTSALTLQVLGNAKAALAVVISVAIFRNPVTLQGTCGFALTLLGVVLYSEAKKRTKPR